MTAITITVDDRQKHQQIEGLPVAVALGRIERQRQQIEALPVVVALGRIERQRQRFEGIAGAIALVRIEHQRQPVKAGGRGPGADRGRQRQQIEGLPVAVALVRIEDASASRSRPVGRRLGADQVLNAIDNPEGLVPVPFSSSGKTGLDLSRYTGNMPIIGRPL